MTASPGLALSPCYGAVFFLAQAFSAERPCANTLPSHNSRRPRRTQNERNAPLKCTIIATPLEIEQAWKALTQAEARCRPLSERRVRKIAEDGWVNTYEIKDDLPMIDRRLDYIWLSNLPSILERIGIQKAANFPREWKYVDEIWGREGLSSSDALRYFWWLERLGFPLDLGGLGDEIARTLPRTNRLSESHLDVLIYCSERYTQPPIKLLAEDSDTFVVNRSQTFTAPNGVKIEIRYDEDDLPISLVSTAPDYLPPKEQTSVRCPVCDMSYVQGLKGDEDLHAIYHRKTLEPLEPRPSRAWKAAVAANSESVWIDATSPTWMHVAMHRRARAFKREFGYDFVQWSDDPGANDNGVAFAFLDEDYRMIGGCRFQIGGGVDGRNRLSFIWFAPGARRKGYLSKVWPRLRDKMGDFDLEPPVSDAMQAFMTQKSQHATSS